ncbi:MAG: helix-turn-helix transcriptional regulator [Christensenellaceae bacterium]|jgi:DNA-binding HxlR family transcriptional regulator|nr:helix-turn-helix transcriptional regulator [Christensenellaceae bacterium]
MIPKDELPECPVAITVGLIGNKWKLLILRDLLDGTKRFGQLLKSVTGISQKVLTDNLRALERDGMVTRAVYAEVPPRVEYALSAMGESLTPILDAMAVWGESYKQQLAKFQ